MSADKAPVSRINAVRRSFARQGFMAHLGAKLVRIGHGTTEIRLPRRPELLQQHGYFHGGAIATIADVAGGYAAYSLMDDDDSVLTVEFKLNLIAPGDGRELRARGHVIRSGRTLTITRADVFAVKNGHEVLCATALQTLIRMAGRPDGPAKAAPHAHANPITSEPKKAKRIKRSRKGLKSGSGRINR